ncbi:lipopolysaccharide kinase InaA family protein [Stutzerimonas zhaodongensis]|uniref:lipopolysaccharide kinase InaA family protein n=1 Tax=Stutzerimonas TaxID=2901164 RepID=UPI00388DDC51
MSDFIAEADRSLLVSRGLANFDALWALQLQSVDEPNVERGGWSSVFRLDLGEASFYLKRQSNHQTRSLARPFGEPTFAREFRNIRRYHKLGIPTLEATFFGRRRVGSEQRAVLMTRALDDWDDLESYLAQWHELDGLQRAAILRATGELANQLHRAGQMHGCFYPKHIFLKQQPKGWRACLIDLEKTRPLLLGRRDRVKDLEPLLRRASCWSQGDIDKLLAAYVRDDSEFNNWALRLNSRRREKEMRT